MRTRKTKQILALGLGIMVGVAVGSVPVGTPLIPMVYAEELPPGNTAPIPTVYTETVDGIEWTYTVYSGVEESEYVYPTNKDTLPDEVVIPDTLGGYPVVRIGANAFSNSKVKSITLPETAVCIEERAFADCEELTTLNLPKEKPLSIVYKEGFKNCKALTDVNVRNTKDSAFEGCTNLKSVTIPVSSFNKAAAIGDGAFKGCVSLEEINLPEEIKEFSIGISGFEGCTSLKKMNCYNSNVMLYKNAMLGCSSLEEFVATGDMNCNSYAFKDCSALKEMIISGNAKFRTGVFDGCINLQKVTFKGESAETNFGEAAFTKILVYDGCKTVSGSIENMESLEKIIFTEKEPDVSGLTYAGRNKVQVAGYCQGSADDEGKGNVYAWAKNINWKKNLLI